jgi:hypothetical protein
MTKSIVLACIISLLIAGCALFGTSQAERAARFEYDLNHNRRDAYQNFLQSATTDYVTLATQNPIYTWNVWFPPAEYPETTEYTISVDEVSGETVKATVSGPLDFTGPKSLTFGMVRSGIYWYIEKLTLDGSVIVD